MAKRYLREGLDNEDQLAVYDLLQRDLLTKGGREATKKGARAINPKAGAVFAHLYTKGLQGGAKGYH